MAFCAAGVKTGVGFVTMEVGKPHQVWPRAGLGLPQPRGLSRCGVVPSGTCQKSTLTLTLSFQCPRINGVKAHTDRRNRRRVVLDLQIW